MIKSKLNQPMTTHQTTTWIFCFALVLFSISLFGCANNSKQKIAEKTALEWVNSYSEEIKKQLLKESPDFSLAGNFYVLKSFSHNDGFCVEIASKARNPPRVDEDNFYDPTTLPLFINADNKIEFSNLDCFAKVYKNSGWEYLQNVQKDFDAENKKDYSIFHYILTREVGIVVMKTMLERKMGNE